MVRNRTIRLADIRNSRLESLYQQPGVTQGGEKYRFSKKMDNSSSSSIV